MKKLIVNKICISCGHSESYNEISCDTCGKNLSIGDGYIIKEIGNPFPLKLSLGNVDYDFCNYKCAISFLIDELTKEKK